MRSWFVVFRNRKRASYRSQETVIRKDRDRRAVKIASEFSWNNSTEKFVLQFKNTGARKRF